MEQSSFQRHEGFTKARDGHSLFFQTWEKPNARGSILITHGQGEHSECYHRFVEAFAGDEWNFWAWDMRGHGRSEGKRGYAADFSDYVADYRLILKNFMDRTEGNGPRALVSHSMGGLVQLQTLIEDKPQGIAGQICSAPLLGVAVPVPAWKQQGAQIMNRLYPQITLWNEIRNEHLTRDPDVIREFEADVLRHNRISPGVYLGFLQAAESVKTRAFEINVPTLFQLPEQDPVVHTPTGRAFFENLGSARKELRVYGEGARHEMYNDVHRAQVFADARAFLDTLKGTTA